MFFNMLMLGLLINVAICGAATLDQKKRIQQLEGLLQSNPSNGQSHFDLAEFLVSIDEKEYYDKALYHFKKAMEIGPHTPSWLLKLAIFSCKIGHIQDSLEAYKAILKVNPTLLQVWYNTGFTFKVAGDYERAKRIYRTIIEKDPEYEPAHLGLAFSYLTNGEFKEGWKEHLWNIKKQKKYSSELHSFITNNTLSGKRILLVPEGGLGDTLHFIRYVQRIKHLGAHTIVTVQKSLIPLLRLCPYIDELYSVGTPTPSYDARCTLMALPTHFQEAEEQLPQNIPYLFANPDRVAYWKDILKHDENFKIGICWQPDVHNDISRLPIARRGIPLSHFYRLASTKSVSVYSLQKIEGLDQLNELPSNVRIHTFNDEFDVAHGSFMDTAAVMQSLDLIISTDTATAHLAGALGKPVWLLLPFNTDWRWIEGRSDSPWYPTMRIFKQQEPFNWDSIIDHLYTVFFQEVYN